MNPVLSPAAVETILSAERLFGSRAVLIGASAVGFWIAMTYRQTRDIDLIVAVSVPDLERLHVELGWERLAEHRFRTRNGILIDVLPCASALAGHDKLEWPESGQVMSLIGLDLALAHGVPRAIHDREIVVAPLPIVVFLKMVSWLDRPAERERDLTDIAHALELYLAEDDVRRWFEFSEVGLPFEHLSAYALAHDLDMHLTAAHRELVDTSQYTRWKSERARTNGTHGATFSARQS